jgi:methylaspartate ammonia-lyase
MLVFIGERGLLRMRGSLVKAETNQAEKLGTKGTRFRVFIAYLSTAIGAFSKRVPPTGIP